MSAEITVYKKDPDGAHLGEIFPEDRYDIYPQNLIGGFEAQFLVDTADWYGKPITDAGTNDLVLVSSDGKTQARIGGDEPTKLKKIVELVEQVTNKDSINDYQIVVLL
ncbi:MAG: hypothetical protein ACHQUA_01865 [Microgenomates group bacterium]